MKLSLFVILVIGTLLVLAKPSPQPGQGSVAPPTLKEEQSCKVECDARKRSTRYAVLLEILLGEEKDWCARINPSILVHYMLLCKIDNEWLSRINMLLLYTFTFDNGYLLL